MLKALFYLVPFLPAIALHAQVTEEFAVDSSDPERSEFPGTTGNGWVSAWIVAPNVGAGGSESFLSPQHPDYLAFPDSPRNYLRLIGKKRADIRASAQRAVTRQYGDFGELKIEQPHRITFQLRLDEWLADLLEFTIFDSTQSAVGPVAGRSTWAIRGASGGNWEFTDNTSGQFITSGIPLEEGSIYHFEIEVSPSENSYNVRVKDLIHQREHRSDHLRFVHKSGSIGAWLGWAMRVQPGGGSSASLSAIEITPIPAD